jgi:hypothetical protein
MDFHFLIVILNRFLAPDPSTELRMVNLKDRFVKWVPYSCHSSSSLAVDGPRKLSSVKSSD